MAHSLAFGDLVQIVESEETSAIGVAGRSGKVVSVRIAGEGREVVGGGKLEDAVLVLVFETGGAAVLIASRLVEPTGEVGEFSVVDALADVRSEHDDVGAASRVRVRATSETEELGLAGLVGEVMGETTPSSSGVDVIGGSGADYAINAWFDEKNEQYWFHPDLLEAADES
jgi:hypothetical protein